MEELKSKTFGDFKKWALSHGWLFVDIFETDHVTEVHEQVNAQFLVPNGQVICVAISGKKDQHYDEYIFNHIV